MRIHHVITVFVAVILFFVIASCSQETHKTGEYLDLSGPYLGQEPPGLTSEMYAPEIVSTEHHEFGITFSPDGKEIFFTRMIPDERIQRIMHTAVDENGWKKPEIAIFSGQHADMEPCFLPNGQEVYFVSFRPVPGFEGMTADIWASEKKDGTWGEAQHLGSPFNPGKAMYFSFSQDGTLYTTDAENRGGILTSTMIDGKYTDFKKLGAPFNTGSEAHPWVAHDESYLIYDGTGETGRGLYVSFKNEEGAWDAPISMKEYTAEGGVAMISPDGKYLFYTDKGNIYWVSTKIIEKLRSEYIHHESQAK